MSCELEALTSSLQQRFGAQVACAVVSVDGDTRDLWPAERELVAGAVPARRREFAAGRACARTLLARLGFEPAALLRASDRAPLWPRGALGSIAHDRRSCAVVVARAGALRALGVDIEPDEPLEDALWPELFVARELALLARLRGRARGRMARRLFSAKECVFKCTHSFMRGTLGFLEAEIVPADRGARFAAVLRRPAGLGPAHMVLEGFHLAGAGSIVTGIALSSAPASPELVDGGGRGASASHAATLRGART